MNGITFIVVLLGLLTTGCTDIDSQEIGLKLPEYNYMEYNKNRLEMAQVKELRNRFSNLIKTEHEFYEKPEFMLVGFEKNEEKTDFYSIYVQEGFIYQGYFLDAWHDRMQGKSSPCYKLDRDTVQFLTQLAQ